MGSRAMRGPSAVARRLDGGHGTNVTTEARSFTEQYGSRGTLEARSGVGRAYAREGVGETRYTQAARRLMRACVYRVSPTPPAGRRPAPTPDLPPYLRVSALKACPGTSVSSVRAAFRTLRVPHLTRTPPGR